MKKKSTVHGVTGCNSNKLEKMNIEEFMELNTESEEVQKKYPNMKPWNIERIQRWNAIGDLTDRACHKCDTKSIYQQEKFDVGGIDYWEHEWYVCLNCLDSNYEENREFGPYI